MIYHSECNHYGGIVCFYSDIFVLLFEIDYLQSLERHKIVNSGKSVVSKVPGGYGTQDSLFE